jgi:hypothetical protein
VSVTDSGGHSAQRTYSLLINALLTITTTALPAGIINQPYPATNILVSGGVTPYAWSATGLPPGLSIAPTTGVITGTPTSVGTFTVSVTVADSGGQTAVAGYVVSVSNPSLIITTTGLPSGATGQGYNAAISATGGVTPYTFSATGLPGGLSINASTGAITGTPSSSGTSSVIVTVTDSGGKFAQTARATYSLTIIAPPPPPLQISTPSLPNGMVGQIYAALIAASGGAGNYSFSVSSGSLPGGVQLALAGQLYGTPTAPGTFNFTVQVSDGQNTSSHGYSITIAPAPLTINGAPPTTVALNSKFPWAACRKCRAYKAAGRRSR